ncbi:MAG: prepilin-type N-terminal cleavage/methylation domain-containing protein [Agarilytica sp.]
MNTSLHKKGFTLIDLMITLSITGILLTIVPPSFQHLIKKTKRDTSIASMYHFYQAGRIMAIEDKKSIHFCGSNELTSCQKRWSKFAILFDDKNNDHKPSQNEILSLQQFNDTSIQFATRASFGKSYTILTQKGSSQLAGSIVYCGKEDLKYYQRLTWNRVGRPYVGSDKNGDGVIDGIKKYITSCRG